MPPTKGSAGKNGSKDKAGQGAGTALVIVESPAKAKTIAGYLGRGYVVESSIGHIRDLPTKAAEIPAKYKGQPWARLGVDVDGDFEPLYVVNTDKKAHVKKLKELMADADELLLATDEDREGEAIAWHLREELNPRIPVRRMVFNEITKDAIQHAANNTRDLNTRLVSAQETRRILDRLYGYEVSPVLWKKVMPKLSAGRVQSVATRLVVERERERMAFTSAEYWDLKAVFDASEAGVPDGPATFPATLLSVDGKRIASGRDFTSQGAVRSDRDVRHLDEAAARGLAERLAGAGFAVKSVERKPYRRSPYAPFRTTTLQQEASRKLNLSAKQTMQVAQRLYENGHITYMRTDSTTLSDSAVNAARNQVRRLYGGDYLPDKPRVYAKKVKNAQEAHEAIRPAGDTFRTPNESGLSGPEFRLYELIWKRTVASQMKDAVGESVTVRIEGTSTGGEVAEFSASGKVITFHGFLKAYVEGSDDPAADLDDRERRLPAMAENDPVKAQNLEAEGHSTRPPARYTEATLVKELEEREIGRPSTYASIIGTILDRGYVFKKGTALVPSFLSFAVVGLMEKHFGRYVDYQFTARMEDDLDRIARGEAQAVPWLRRFYFGTDGVETPVDERSGADHLAGLKELVTDLGAIDAREVSSFPVGEGIVLRVAIAERDGLGLRLRRSREWAESPDAAKAHRPPRRGRRAGARPGPPHARVQGLPRARGGGRHRDHEPPDAARPRSPRGTRLAGAVPGGRRPPRLHALPHVVHHVPPDGELRHGTVSGDVGGGRDGRNARGARPLRRRRLGVRHVERREPDDHDHGDRGSRRARDRGDMRPVALMAPPHERFHAWQPYRSLGRE